VQGYLPQVRSAPPCRCSPEKMKPTTKATIQHPSAETVFSPAHSMAIVDLADDAIISVGSDQRIILYNHGAERIFGFSAEQVAGQPLDLLLPERFAQAHCGHVRDFAEGPASARRMGERREIFARRRDGTEFPAEASISKANVNGAWIFTVILRDVTERKVAEEKIQVSLREKEVLLKEIHHRVKNNLQVVSSLLGLQSRVIADPQTRRMFQESQNRIHSMALLHERLYQSENLSEIDYHQYVCELTAHLFRTYGVSASRVDLKINFEETRMNLDAAVPCGLILNELVSNCLKHAFPDGRSGEIRIELRKDGGLLASLLVADTGVGLPEDISLWNSKSLGLRLVRILANNMGAAVEVSSRLGTEVKLVFPDTRAATEGSA
jgi:PAS domain S-box-containing protein